MMAQNTSANRISRRDFLFVSAVAGGGVVAGLASTRAAASSKMSPKAMQYRPSPNGNQRCDNCKNWLAPGACKLVDGPIAPSGWCMLYNAKS